MRAGQVVKMAYASMAGVVGEISMALEREKPIPHDHLESWITRLRAAADQLETMIKGPKK